MLFQQRQPVLNVLEACAADRHQIRQDVAPSHFLIQALSTNTIVSIVNETTVRFGIRDVFARDHQFRVGTCRCHRSSLLLKTPHCTACVVPLSTWAKSTQEKFVILCIFLCEWRRRVADVVNGVMSIEIRFAENGVIHQ